MKSIVVCNSAIYFLLVLTSSVHAQFTKPADGPFTDVPLLDRSYQDVNVLHDAGVITGGTLDYFFSKGGRGTRYNFVVIAARLLPLLSPRPTRALTERADYLSPDAESRLIHSPQALAALLELLRDFHYELERNLHIDVASAQARLVTLIRTADASASPAGRAFSDVPTSHWAAQAVKSLDKAGIVVGYPSYRFNE